MPFTNAFHKQLKQCESFYVCHSPNKKKVLLRSLFTFLLKLSSQVFIIVFHFLFPCISLKFHHHQDFKIIKWVFRNCLESIS